MPFSLRSLALGGRKKGKVYKTLNPASQEIRLLTLLPGSLPNSINCRLQVSSLTDQPSYTTISYVWGTRQIQREIVINGAVVSVNENVYDMLVWLRDPWNEQIIWIDALCINQEDVIEKSHQVSMMGTIYSNALRTLIWLGPSSEDSDLAMDLVAKADLGDFELPQILASKERHWKALYNLMRRAWWSRLWIVQEACLSKQAIVKCGDKELDLRHFRDFYEVHKRFVRDPKRLFPPYISILFATVPFAYVMSSWNLAMARVAEGQGSLSAWLIYTTYAQHTLPRDKLFALLSLSSAEDRKAIRIDYQRPDRDVFKEAAAHFIRKTGLISLMAGRVQKTVNYNLPSWAPDWTFQNPPVGIHFLAPPRCPYQADGDAAIWQTLKVPDWNLKGEITPMEKPARFSLDGEILAVRGLIFDEIEFADSSFLASESHDQLAAAVKAGQLEENLVPSITSTISFWEACAMSYDKNAYRYTCGQYEAFWRALIADRGPAWENTLEDYAARFETLKDWQNFSMSQAQKVTFLQPFLKRAIACCTQRAFFISKKGFFGLAPSNTHIGDLVCVLKGGSAPFVLRRKDGKYYQFLGDSYMHGIMNGECVQQAKPGDVKEFWIR